MSPKTTRLPGHDFFILLGIAGARKASRPWDREEEPEDILGDELPLGRQLGIPNRLKRWTFHISYRWMRTKNGSDISSDCFSF